MNALGKLDAFSMIVPDVDMFIPMHITKEAMKLSRIEGTKTEFDEAVRDEEFIAPERRDDWREVHNYTIAMNRAIEALDTLPLSLRLLRNCHEQLMENVRGGAYSKLQVNSDTVRTG